MKKLFALLTIFTLQPILCMNSDQNGLPAIAQKSDGREPSQDKRPRIGQSDEFTDQNQQTTIVCPPAMPIPLELRATAENVNRAIRENNPTSCEWFINQGVDVNTPDNKGETFLMHAAKTGRKEICEVLISHGAQVDAKNYLDVTALLFAAFYGDHAICELLIAHGAQINTQDTQGQSALMYAAMRAFTNVCEFLINHGADIHAQDVQGETALHLAASKGAHKICRSLLAHGANPNALKNNGTPVLVLCIRSYRCISANEQRKCIKALLEYGADVNLLSDGKSIDYSPKANNSGYTPLMEAIRKCLPKVSKDLLQWGADYKYQNNAGESAISTLRNLEDDALDVDEQDEIDTQETLDPLFDDPQEMRELMLKPKNPRLKRVFGTYAGISEAMRKRELGKK